MRLISGTLGVEVNGTKLCVPLPEDAIDDIIPTFSQPLVLLFLTREMTSQQNTKFTDQSIDSTGHLFVQSIEGFPGIIEIIKDRDKKTN